MNNNTTVEKMKQMRLSGMAEAHYGSIQAANYQDYTIDQYLAMLIDQEWDFRQDKKISGLKTKAKFNSSDYEVREKGGRFFAVTKSPEGTHECWRVLSKVQAENFKK